MKKIEAVRTIFLRPEIYPQLNAATGIRRQELEQVAVWSDVVRDARNTIHFGVLPASPNTYEKLTLLLLGGAQYVRVLYKLKSAA